MGIRKFHLEPSATCSGNTVVPGDKSISHRAIMLASLAEGVSKITGFLPSTDCAATLNAFQSMGVTIEQESETTLHIHGVGLKGLAPPESEMEMGNSGTAMRLLAGVLAGQNFAATLTGDSSLSQRPMQRIQTPLEQMGANIISSDDNTPPLNLQPCKSMIGIHYKLPVPSAQVKSCVLLAGMYAQGTTCIEESVATRDHTERMLQAFGYSLERYESKICLQGNGKLVATHIEIPGDISSAAFLIVGALISKNSQLTIRNVGVNPTRDGVIQILHLMGANIQLSNERMMGAEPVADIIVKSSQLSGIEIPKELIANAIDEFPIIFIAAACATGNTLLSGAEELRVKESDRITLMSNGLKSLGAKVVEKQDGLDICGGQLSGGEVDSGGDHRVAMAFAIASLQANSTITILNTENVMTSFPNFVETLADLGLNITQH